MVNGVEGGFGVAALPQNIRQAFAQDPRTAQAQALLQQSRQPIAKGQDPFAFGITALGGALLGGLQQRQLRDEQREAGDEFREVQQEAMAALLEGDREGAVEILAQSPFGQEQAFQLASQQIQRSEQLADVADQREFQVSEREAGQTFTTGERVSGQEFKTSERLGAQAFTADQKALDRKAAALLAALKQKKEATSKDFEKSRDLRKEFDKNSGEFIKVRDAYGRIQASKDGTAAGDLALIFNYMKMLDPGSTVREGEFANAQNAAGVPDRVRAFFNNVQRGERMTEAQRADFVGQADKLFTSQRKIQESNIQRFTEISNKFGLDPKDIVTDFSSSVIARKEAKQGPTIRGQTVQGDPLAEARKRGLIK